MVITDEMAAQAEKNLKRLFEGVQDPELEVLEKHRELIREVFAYSDYVSWYAIKWRSRFVRMLESGEYEWSHRYESYRSEIRVLIRDIQNLDLLKKTVREFRNDKISFSEINAMNTEIAMRLEEQGYEVIFKYPEDCSQFSIDAAMLINKEAQEKVAQSGL